MISLKDVSKIYYSQKKKSQTHALKNVNLEINEGDFVGIVGPSGCGKTTMLNLIGGLDKPTKGRIYHNQTDITAFSADKLAKFRNQHTGFVFQSFFLESNDTVLGNVILPLIIAGVPKSQREEKAKRILFELNLESKLNSIVGELSGGEKQRVCVARALVNNPNLLLADEPTGNLDSKNGTEVLELFKEINKKGKTVILVTHNEEYMKYCSRIIKLQDGAVEIAYEN